VGRTDQWRLVVPVKPSTAPAPPKSRLVAPPGIDHDALAEAFALDTITAAADAVGAAHVYAVTAGLRARHLQAAAGVRVVADPGTGLNAAVRAGLAACRSELPHHESRSGIGRDPRGVAVLLADLPALTPSELLQALAAAIQEPLAFVPDHQGWGTVLLAARLDRSAPGASPGGKRPVGALVTGDRHTTGEIRPSFGPGSAARHEAAGHRRLELDLPRLRADVDDAASLHLAIALGVGRHTAAVLGQ
jgi:2-phospho-L-lactate guanylyltransferase